ncbi:PAS domain-containing protein [Hwanghaeella grinnelliae]|uniref:PAS domain-containing protein n=1 Tax=Hwanghaeella grinnelliae TaxID=2500179 RepID=A0A3S2VPX9_9PROT|nr:PAS domain-containing protein [Hwanghaeella grinnelliae]RVU38892.1 PAS domain-containing protein [Hwanghaeella grinnelliae]
MEHTGHDGFARPADEILPPGTDARLLVFFDAWRSARSGAAVPTKRDFDPFQMPALLRFTWLYRDDPVAGDFVCLLAGEEVNRAWGHPIKDKTLRQVVGDEDYPVVQARWRKIIDTPLVQYGAKQEKLSSQDLWRAERLLMPLASADGRIDHVIGVSLYRLAGSEQKRMALFEEDIVQIPCAEI